MDHTIHHVHTIVLSPSVLFALGLILAVIVFCTVYPMVMTPSLPPDPPRNPIGFNQGK